MSPVRLTICALALVAGIAGCSGDGTPPPEARDAPYSDDPMVEAHIEAIRQRVNANNAKDWDTWESLHVEDAVRTAPELLEPVVGAHAMRAGIEELIVTFPDYHLTLIDAFGVGARLVARIHTRATMLGSMQLGT